MGVDMQTIWQYLLHGHGIIHMIVAFFAIYFAFFAVLIPCGAFMGWILTSGDGDPPSDYY